MRLAVSNIAWPAELEADAADLLQRLGVRGVEIAPTMVWDAPLQASDAEIARYRQSWTDRGIEIVALQALLFGRPDLTLFGTEDGRKQALLYLSGMIRLSAHLGASVLVFGSPRNRRRDALDDAEAGRLAISFFGELGRRASDLGVTFCIEPNPVAYDCDFITTSAQAIELVRDAGTAGFGLHLDAAAMTLSDEPIEEALGRSQPWCRHFHISEPHLQPIGKGGVNHQLFGTTLRRLGYPHWLSIEMRVRNADSCLADVANAVREARASYDDLHGTPRSPELVVPP